jgi:hypothetical protein
MMSETSVYLRRVAEASLFSAPVNAHLLAAALEYRAAYESWQQLYEQYLGHGVPEEKRKTKEHLGSTGSSRLASLQRARLTA